MDGAAGCVVDVVFVLSFRSWGFRMSRAACGDCVAVSAMLVAS